MNLEKDTNTLDFHDYVEQAIGHLQEATSSISYTSFPDINKNAIQKLNTVLGLLNDVLEDDIFKPKKEN